MGKKRQAAGRKNDGATLAEVIAEVAIILGKTPSEIGRMTFSQTEAVYKAHARMKRRENASFAAVVRTAFGADKKGFKEFYEALTKEETETE